jgi:ribonucleoside-triphosphate reductase
MSKITNTFTKLTPKQLEQKKAFIDNYIKAHNAAEGSAVDANSNVTNKNVATLAAELNKDINVQIKRYCISQKIKELFGEDLAKEYNRQIENHEIYIHDESHPFFDYCASVTLYPFLLNGLKGLGGESVAPKHLESFCGSFINLVFALSSQLAGAVATVEFLICFDYFARKDYGDNYLETHKKIIENAFQQIIYSMNQPASARGFQSIFWNISIFDDNYLKSLFGEFVFPDYSKPNFETVKKLQAFFMNWFNEERRRALLTFPVITAALVVDENGPIDQEFLDMCADQDSKGNSFFKYESDSVDSLASCCRLRNELQDNTFSFTLGAGGTQAGSINVITININRLVQNATRQNKDIETELKLQVEKIHKYQVATKAYYMDYYNAGMMPLYTLGFLSLDKKFLTIGINGFIEAAEFKGLSIDNNQEYLDFTTKLLKVIYDTNKEGKSKYGVMFNTEFVPAENLGVKNYAWDKADGYVVPENRDCYNSYLYKVEDSEIDAIDKFILHGKQNLQYLDGGSALHLNLEEYPTKESYKKLYCVAAKTGCNYWTTNVKVTICEDCGYINKHTLNECTKCHSKNVSHATRVIGYLRKISNFSPERQKEADKRFYTKTI